MDVSNTTPPQLADFLLSLPPQGLHPFYPPLRSTRLTSQHDASRSDCLDSLHVFSAPRRHSLVLDPLVQHFATALLPCHCPHPRRAHRRRRRGRSCDVLRRDLTRRFQSTCHRCLTKSLRSRRGVRQRFPCGDVRLPPLTSVPKSALTSYRRGTGWRARDT
ncbi:hypothetical protein PYCCODRAFT_1013719 [Trametes coccinea BRFM310]|uniref:Uncharacterized protein n=1 Tax=Trametes coccinea (strain BRFM310) TaxID=1353009 RepID=A0A1Y2ICX3_TRAC3|nr:hypothetical protein PYCCODRAFT_1013719 [Trametes coccinea BRFM310]